MTSQSYRDRVQPWGRAYHRILCYIEFFIRRVVRNRPVRMWEQPEHADSALIAQLAEHALSKRKVTSSNLVGGFPVRVGVVGNISACHADAPGSIPGRGAVFAVFGSKGPSRPRIRTKNILHPRAPAGAPLNNFFATPAPHRIRRPMPPVAPISAPVAQLAARGSHNPKVASSILAGSIIFLHSQTRVCLLVLSNFFFKYRHWVDPGDCFPNSLVGQDMWFSPTRPGFESRLGNFLYFSLVVQ